MTPEECRYLWEFLMHDQGLTRFFHFFLWLMSGC
jgi:hypothetical protein